MPLACVVGETWQATTLPGQECFGLCCVRKQATGSHALQQKIQKFKIARPSAAACKLQRVAHVNAPPQRGIAHCEAHTFVRHEFRYTIL